MNDRPTTDWPDPVALADRPGVDAASAEGAPLDRGVLDRGVLDPASLTGLLRLAQWLSPAFPTGAFAYSHGLEAAITADEALRAAPAVEGWIRAVVLRGSGRIEAHLLARALAPGADPADLAEEARALAATRERLAETEEQGAAFTRLVNALEGTDHPPAPLPVAVGRAAAPLGLAPATVIALYLQNFAAMLVGAAVRFAPLGQTEGQAILTRLAPDLAALAEHAERAARADPTGLPVSAAFGADLAAMAHEVQEVRLFKS
ncbi:urease accessory protein UreF [Phaeovulum vinaykumarii]|uniref:Urease accessory protein UreF n=1 Tax=Phaeovulum vinaykumarii TaxID=407234 RepID=A0A1N7LW98_9RHOB|nr:urease accessory UreF family protein [Phaeovulum vinaykumarii]SIS78087.1 urease accessory protein [Phaeovulum vinaykumarii]SOC07166.1 urease accessory protein [Phaeovulum vinaykumarii]